MRPLSDSERRDVVETIAELKRAKTDWRRTAGMFGEYTAQPILLQIRSAVRDLRRYVRASREHGIDIMPTLRAELPRALCLVANRRKPSYLWHPRAAERAARVIARIRNA
jgi:hypothetical protein